MNYSKIKVIYFNSKEIKHDDIIWGLLELGIDVNRSATEITYNTINDAEVSSLITEIPNYDLAFTQDFSVNVAQACHLCGVKYISWTYDSPQVALHTDFALYDENYIFAFDKVQYNLLQDFGVKHIFYQPLAANTSFQSTVKTNMKDAQTYTADISFVGQLYRKSNLNSLFSLFSEEQKNLFIKYCNIYSCKWNCNLNIYDNTFDDFVQTLIPYINKEEFSYYKMDPIYVVKSLFLGPFITHFERVRILSELSNNFDATLYTSNTDYEYAKTFFNGNLFPSIKREESYKLFKFSKLNLNMTLRTIESGIPLRVFDIMGMGGAVITNWQPEIEELFIPGKDIIIYHSLEELIEKVDFYLKNDKARKSIALNGKNRILNDYNMLKAIKNIIDQTLD